MAKSTSIRFAFQDAVIASRLNTSAKTVGLVIFRYMNSSGYAWPSKATIAGGAGLSIRSADRAVDRLEAAGLLTVTHSPGRRPNVYGVGPTVAFNPVTSDVVGRGSTPSPVAGFNPVRNDIQPRQKRHPTPSETTSNPVI